MPFFHMRLRRFAGAEVGFPHGSGSGCVLLIAATIGLCGAPQAARALPQAANAEAPAPRTTYRPVIENYTPFRPVEPKGWGDVNKEVTPKPKPKPEGEKPR